MKKPTRLISLLSIACATMAPMSAETSGVQIEAKDSGGNSTGVAPITLSSKIRFTDAGVVVSDTGSDVATFPYANCATLTFIVPNVIEGVQSETSLFLLTNPVDNLLEFGGIKDEESALAIYSLKGETLYVNNQWQGESVDVSSYAPGFYIATVNKQTFKFIKK